jgi:psiF repeat
MHTWLGALVSILLVAGSTAGADEKKEPSTPQAQRMTECNAQARDRHLSGDERRHFMSDCLKAQPAARDAAARSDKTAKSRPTDGAHSGQGEKMKACNQEAAGKNLHGDERKQFMSHCLKAEKNP